MNQPPKPGFWLIVNSVAVIALCSLPVSTGAAVMASWYRAGAPGGVEMLGAIVLGVLFCAPSTMLGVCQYRGTFRGDGGSARNVAPLAVAASLTLWPVAVAAIERWADASAVGGRLRQAMFFGVTLGLAGFAAFTAWTNRRWSEKLQAIGDQPWPRQFSIRDLLAITIWLALVAGITRCIVVAVR